MARAWTWLYPAPRSPLWGSLRGLQAGSRADLIRARRERAQWLLMMRRMRAMEKLVASMQVSAQRVGEAMQHVVRAMSTTGLTFVRHVDAGKVAADREHRRRHGITW